MLGISYTLFEVISIGTIHFRQSRMENAQLQFEVRQKLRKW